MERLPDVYVDQELAAMVRKLAADRGVSYAALARSALKLLVVLEIERALLAAREGSTNRSCVVCELPRRADATEDGLAHAQCDQIVANLGKAMRS